MDVCIGVGVRVGEPGVVVAEIIVGAVVRVAVGVDVRVAVGVGLVMGVGLISPFVFINGSVLQRPSVMLGPVENLYANPEMPLPTASLIPPAEKVTS